MVILLWILAGIQMITIGATLTDKDNTVGASLFSALCSAGYAWLFIYLAAHWGICK